MFAKKNDYYTYTVFFQSVHKIIIMKSPHSNLRLAYFLHFTKQDLINARVQHYIIYVQLS